ncbi:MAG: DUF1749 domain-containing protein [Microgenomates group bacterium]
MNYPIVKVKTSDDIALFGFLSETSKKDTILINIHGTGSCFYAEEFEGEFVERLPKLDISVLFTNNRGNYTLESWQATGCAREKFEECLIDIDTWIEFALDKGYKKIILQGHSLGTEKVTYYMEKGKHKDKIIGVILLGFADSFGCQMKFLETQKIDPMINALELIKEDRGHELITSIHLCHAGVLPKTANSYVNCFSEGSELSKALPLRKGKGLVYYQNIKVPILGVICDTDEWNEMLGVDTVTLLKNENSNAQIETISDTDHSFTGKKIELVDIVEDFIKNKLI